jgi:hypothetical protein
VLGVLDRTGFPAELEVEAELDVRLPGLEAKSCMSSANSPK